MKNYSFHGLQWGYFLPALCIILSSALRGSINDHAYNTDIDFGGYTTRHFTNSMEVIGWADRLLYIWVNDTGGFTCRAAWVGLEDDDSKPFINDEEYERNFSRGWRDPDNLNLIPALFGNDVYLFVTQNGSKTADFYILSKNINDTRASKIHISGANELTFDKLPDGWGLGNGCAFSIGGDIYLLISNANDNKGSPGVFKYDGFNTAAFLGTLDQLGASGTTYDGEGTRNFRAAHLLIGQGDEPKDVAALSLRKNGDVAQVVLFDGTKVVAHKAFKRSDMGIENDVELYGASIATGALGGGPDIESPAVQLFLVDSNTTLYGQAVEYDGKDLKLSGKAQNYNDQDDFNASPLTLRATSVVKESRKDSGSLRRIVIATGADRSSRGRIATLNIFATQSDLLKIDNYAYIDTFNFSVSTKDDPVPKQITDEKQIAGFRNFWKILGVVTGVPPYTKTTPADKVGSKIEWVTTQGDASTITHGSSVSISGGIIGKAAKGVGSLNLDAGAAWATYHSSGRTTSFSKSQTLIPPADSKGNIVGWLVTYQPIITAISYHLYSPNSGKDLGRNYVFFGDDGELNKDRTFIMETFNLTSPNSTSSAISNGMFDGKTTSGWPSSNDPNGWNNFTFSEPYDFIILPELAARQGSETQTQFLVDSNNSIQNSNSLTFTRQYVIPFAEDLYGLGLGGSLSFTNTRTQTTHFSKRLSMQVGGITTEGKPGDVTKYNIIPMLLFPKPDSNWIPKKAFPDAAPWCLSYITTAVHTVAKATTFERGFGEVFPSESDPSIFFTSMFGWVQDTGTFWFYDYVNSRWLYRYIMSQPDDFWFYFIDDGWSWSNENLYPWTYNADFGEWLYSGSL